MSLIPFLLLAREAEKRSHRSSSKKTDSKHDDNNDHQYSSHDLTAEDIFEDNIFGSYRTAPLNRCLQYRLQTNEEVSVIIKKLIDKTEQILDEDEKEIDDKIFNLCSESIQLSSEYMLAKKQVKELGFKLSSNKSEISYVIPSENEQGFVRNTTEEDSLICGYELTKNDILSGENPYSKRYENFISEHPNLFEQLQATRKKVTKLKKRVIALKLSEKKRIELSKAEKELQALEKLYATEQEYKANAELYSSLTEEQKQIILKYLEIKDAFKEHGSVVIGLFNESLLKRGYGTGYGDNKEIYTNYIKEVLSEAKASLSPEELETLQSFLKETAEIICSADSDKLKELTSTRSNSVTQAGHIIVNYACHEIKNYGEKILQTNETQAEDE